MNPVRRQKIIMICVLAFGFVLAAGLVLYALRQNISLFYTPSQIFNHEAPVNVSMRLGGMVKKGSVKRQANNLQLQFTLTDFNHEVIVFYEGILPDLFREGQGIVTTGRINDNGQFMADNVLAKHDENYMPPEVKASINKTSAKGDGR